MLSASPPRVADAKCSTRDSQTRLRDVVWADRDRTYTNHTFKNIKFKNMNVKELIPASDKAAQLLKSLSHPQRLLILCALGRKECSVADLRDELGIDQVPMSQQLMRLRADGLVAARRVGTSVHYRITRLEILAIVEALHAAFCPDAETDKVCTATNQQLA